VKKKRGRNIVTSAVIDTSALLALCFVEPGADATIAHGKNGILSAVSYSETIAKAGDEGMPTEEVAEALALLKLTIVPFDEAHAVAAASFRPATRNLNVSFADRACLGAALLSNRPVLTADRKWEKISCGVEMIFIR
jgi:ribonuclease VapC